MQTTNAPESPEAALRKKSEDDDPYRFGRPPEDLPSFRPAPPSRVTDHAGVSIQTIDLAKSADRKRFIDMADSIYAGDPNYIAPLKMHQNKFLDPAKNPAYDNLDVHPILALKGDKIVGRMSVHIDRAYNRYHESKTGLFGFFECINDRAVAHAMLDHATAWLQEKGCEEFFGPMNFTLNHQGGLLIENFDRPPFVEQTYNPSYYEELFNSYGFGKAKDLLVWWIDVAEGNTTKKRQRVARIAERIKKREGVTIRHLNMNDVPGELKNIFDIYLSAWQKNWGFVPLDFKEWEWLMTDLKQIVVPELVIFVEFEGKAVGFSATVPNVNEHMPKNGRLFPFGWFKLATKAKKTKCARLYTLGVVPEYRKRGLEAMMFSETVVRAQKVGFLSGEIGWTLDDNDLINRAIESMDGKLDRRYRILGMTL